MQGWDNLPEKFHENVRLLEKFNPDFEHRRWDEDRLRLECAKMGKPYLDKFNSFDELIMRVDYGRYIVLYQYGGVSVDTDMKSLKSLSHTPGIETDTFIISPTGASILLPIHSLTSLYNNAIFLVRPRHPIMKEIIDECTNSRKTRKNYPLKELYVDGETGPSFISRVLEKHKKHIKVIDAKYFEPCLSMDPFCKVPESSILDHKHQNSWIDPNLQSFFTFLFFLYHNLWIIGPLIILIVLSFIPFGKPISPIIIRTPGRK